MRFEKKIYRATKASQIGQRLIIFLNCADQSLSSKTILIKTFLYRCKEVSSLSISLPTKLGKGREEERRREKRRGLFHPSRIAESVKMFHFPGNFVGWRPEVTLKPGIKNVPTRVFKRSENGFPLRPQRDSSPLPPERIFRASSTLSRSPNDDISKSSSSLQTGSGGIPARSRLPRIIFLRPFSKFVISTFYIYLFSKRWMFRYLLLLLLLFYPRKIIMYHETKILLLLSYKIHA